MTHTSLNRTERDRAAAPRSLIVLTIRTEPDARGGDRLVVDVDERAAPDERRWRRVDAEVNTVDDHLWRPAGDGLDAPVDDGAAGVATGADHGVDVDVELMSSTLGEDDGRTRRRSTVTPTSPCPPAPTIRRARRSLPVAVTLAFVAVAVAVIVALAPSRQQTAAVVAPAPPAAETPPNDVSVPSSAPPDERRSPALPTSMVPANQCWHLMVATAKVVGVDLDYLGWWVLSVNDGVDRDGRTLDGAIHDRLVIARAVVMQSPDNDPERVRRLEQVDAVIAEAADQPCASQG